MYFWYSSLVLMEIATRPSWHYNVQCITLGLSSFLLPSQRINIPNIYIVDNFFGERLQNLLTLWKCSDLCETFSIFATCVQWREHNDFIIICCLSVCQHFNICLTIKKTIRDISLKTLFTYMYKIFQWSCVLWLI